MDHASGRFIWCACRSLGCAARERVAGIEPTTSSLEEKRSAHLSYTRLTCTISRGKLYVKGFEAVSSVSMSRGISQARPLRSR